MCYMNMQDKGSGANDETSSNGSAAGGTTGGSDKTTPLTVLHEFSLRALMVRGSLRPLLAQWI